MSSIFPAINGSCFCCTIRFRLLASPLYCYACHCADCQKSTGSAFGLFLNIESSNIRILSELAPVEILREKKPGLFDRHVECPRCKTELWSNHIFGAAIADVRVGTLDLPSLMEPDLHMFVESKLDWVILPKGARVTPKDYQPKELWPQSSLKRLEICLRKTKEIEQKRLPMVVPATARTEEGSLAAAQQIRMEEESEQTSGEGDTTPTGIEFEDKDPEDYAVFEKRIDDTEKALLERLEKLRIKLEGDTTKKTIIE